MNNPLKTFIMKTKLSPSWIAVAVILFIIAIGALLVQEYVGFIFFLGTASWIVYCKLNTLDVENTTTNKPFSNSSVMNELH